MEWAAGPNWSSDAPPEQLKQLNAREEVWVDKRKIRIESVRREPVDLDRLASALLALAVQLADEDDVSNTVVDSDVRGASEGDNDDEASP